MIILGLGSNVGDRLSYLDRAVKRLSGFIYGIRLSSILESKALLPENAPASWDSSFLNMALMANTVLPAHVLIEEIKRLEADLGRSTRGKWGPREIDIDILAYDDLIISNDRIRIPHPELLNRDFALLPFAELAPDWRYPVEGAYHGWRAADIAREKKFAYGPGLMPTGMTIDV